MNRDVYRGPERRSLNVDLISLQRLLDKEFEKSRERFHEFEISIEYLKQKMDEMHKDKREFNERMSGMLQKHNETIYGNGHEGLTTKVSAIKALREELSNHSNVDRWMFGTVIVILLFILGKMFIG